MSNRTIPVLSVMALVLAGAYSLGTSSAITAREMGTAQAEPAASGAPEMMKMHQAMMADMKADRTRLDGLVKEMNDASGEARVDAVVAVMNELVRQHQSMHGRMGEMHQRMMGGKGMMRDR